MGNRIDEKRILELIEKYRGAKFLHNGRSLEEGIDCLGFVILFYRDLGVDLPNDDGKPIEEDWYKTNPNRYIRAIKNLGFKEVRFRDLRPLDMVYFAISHNIITHTGIMINKREFAHMSPNKNFLISKLERGWLSRARGAIRVIE
ncbi:MAG: peptidoglycan endopeptidase [Clostridiales bacterium]|jgi:cell wall-associated NlpC family hydrolase|nr:peptidoglycan endopeptidase [Clostridiales bacterium]